MNRCDEHEQGRVRVEWDIGDGCPLCAAYNSDAALEKVVRALESDLLRERVARRHAFQKLIDMGVKPPPDPER